MDIHKYVVSVQPEDWSDGTYHDTYWEAVAHASKIAGCITEVVYSFDDSELVTDFRKEETPCEARAAIAKAKGEVDDE
mgnify:CR=1 FL=1